MNKTRKMVITSVIIAISVIGNSLVVIPIGIFKAAPIQHLMNVLTAVWLGPAYAVAAAFLTSLIRNLIGTGTIFAFGGSMIGALFAGLFYVWKKKVAWAALGELIGTGILGAVVSTLIAQLILGKETALVAFLPSFFLSALIGSALAYAILKALKGRNLLGELDNNKMQSKNKGE